jgi:hypothetical protein
MFTSDLFRIFASQQSTSLFAGGTAINIYRNFLNDPQLNGPVSNNRIGPDITFTRNSYATYFNNLGILQTAGNNVPRFEYTQTGQPKGLLIEGQATNLVEYSINFNGNTWTTSTSSIALTSNVPGILAPDNTETATLITSTTAYGPHAIYWSGTPAPWEGNLTIPKEYYNRSIFIKQHTSRYVVFSVCAQLSAFAGGESPTGSEPDFENLTNIFDFNTESFVYSPELSRIVVNVLPVNNGWYRVDFGRLSSNFSSNRLAVGISNGPTFNDTYFTGNVNSLSGVYIWGAQAEKSYKPTSYIPTNGTQVVRAEDRASVIRNAFSKNYNPVESSFLISGVCNNINETNTFASFANRDSTKYWTLNTNLSGQQHRLTVSTIITSLQTPSISSYKLVAGLKDNDIVFYQNDTFIGSLTSGLLPTKPVAINQLQLGRLGNINYLNGYIHEFGYWPTRLTNSILSSLSAF